MKNIISKIVIEKGKPGYINRQKIIQTILTVFMFGCALAIYYIGYSVLKTNKSIWSIIAVLGILPAAKRAVNMIMFFRFNSISSEELNKIEDVRDTIPVIYDLVFTSSEKASLIKACACTRKTIIMYAGKNKENKSELSSRINDYMNAEGLSDYSLIIYDNLDGFIKRMNEMKKNLGSVEDNSNIAVFNLYKAVTL